MKAQAIAISLVVASGVALFIATMTTYRSLRASEAVFYRQQRFGEPSTCSHVSLLIDPHRAPMTGSRMHVPVIVSLPTYAFALVVFIAPALVSALVVRQRIDRLDLIEVLKARE